jgi:hypothetical protein
VPKARLSLEGETVLDIERHYPGFTSRLVGGSHSLNEKQDCDDQS